jgi:ribosomal protein S18 acetylase RimI-like enzyme
MSDASETVVFGEEPELSAEEFLELARSVWPRDYWLDGAQRALGTTINLTARADGALIGCARILTDGYFFGTIPEVIVHPDHQGLGIGRKLMELVWQRSPTGLFFGAQEGNEEFFEKLGFERSMTSFARKKPRPKSDE